MAIVQTVAASAIIQPILGRVIIKAYVTIQWPSILMGSPLESDATPFDLSSGFF